MKRRQLPPLNGLRAFEAAARHLSFKMAAEELHVTPAAISQQVRALEAHIGKPLFRRLTREIALTDTGRVGLAALGEGFDRLQDGVEAMRRRKRLDFLTVSVPPTFGAKWLVPRLESFRAAHPAFDIRIDASDALSDFSADGVDVALRYGRGKYGGLATELLMKENAFPVCSASLMERGPALRAPADLLSHTLLHVQRKLDDEAAPTWRMWLRAAGLDTAEADRGPRFSLETMALEAAAEGYGVALASGASVAADLRSGRLVRPFPPTVSEATAFSYYLVYPPENASDPKVMAFREWVLAEIAATQEGQHAETAL